MTRPSNGSRCSISSITKTLELDSNLFYAFALPFWFFGSQICNLKRTMLLGALSFIYC
ncbi:hypothetical protein LINPERPRIM_LOCUS25904 [Linum perenne]